ncbi:putative leucine-rich repeat receptor-like protein kinase [Dorcoceras hygrometricum]|uniref:Putative leucine-rich repeat receptor-like protein kinase n=1 Tax=Dorcoceras hygrometricum TaxID=472368 RepID=A0A2Z7AMM3_9LAMI|nr:putative leucine-rich repeat receptor-like protein kinase [Dorcoceras hygrometricum]
MQHAIINAMKCMRAIKDRIARPVYQLAIISIEPLYHAQQVSRWKSSVRDLQDPSAHHSSVVFRHDKSIGHHSDDSVVLFRNDKSVGQSQRGSQSGHQSICQAQYNSKDTAQVTEANQLLPATTITAGEHPNLNLLGKLINQIMSNSNLDISFSLEPNSELTGTTVRRNQQLRNLLQGRSTYSNGQQSKEQVSRIPAPPKSLKSSAENGGNRRN